MKVAIVANALRVLTGVLAMILLLAAVMAALAVAEVASNNYYNKRCISN